MHGLKIRGRSLTFLIFSTHCGKTNNFVEKLFLFTYLRNSSCEADNGPLDLDGSSLNDLGVGGLPSMILLWLSASSRLNSWLGVDKWSCKKQIHQCHTTKLSGKKQNKNTTPIIFSGFLFLQFSDLIVHSILVMKVNLRISVHLLRQYNNFWRKKKLQKITWDSFFRQIRRWIPW